MIETEPLLPLDLSPGLTGRAPVVRLATASLLLGAALGVYLPFLAVTLVDQGLTVGEVGLVVALGSLGFIVVVPVWGHLADTRVGRPRMLGILSVAGGITLASVALGFPPFITGVVYVLGSLFLLGWMPLNDAVLVNALPDGARYARVRMLLSLSYAAAAAAAGVVYARTGFTASLVFVGVGGLTLALAALRLPDVGRLAAVERRSGNPLGVLYASARRAFAIAPTLPGILLAIVFMALGYGAGNTYLGLQILFIGGSPMDVALSGSISAAVEVPAMLLAGVIASRWGIRTLFIASAVVMTLIPLSWAVLTDVPLILLGRALAGFGYAGMIVCGVLTMRVLLPAELQGTGQTLFQATCFGLAGIVVSLTGGLLATVLGYPAVFAVLGSLAGLSIVIGWYAFGRLPATRLPAA